MRPAFSQGTMDTVSYRGVGAGPERYFSRSIVKPTLRSPQPLLMLKVWGCAASISVSHSRGKKTGLKSHLGVC